MTQRITIENYLKSGVCIKIELYYSTLHQYNLSLRWKSDLRISKKNIRFTIEPKVYF